MKNINKVLVLCLTSLLPICGNVSAMRTPAAFTQQSSVLHRTIIERDNSENDRSQAEMRNQTQEQFFSDRMMSYANDAINLVRNGVNQVMNIASRALRWLGHTVRGTMDTIQAYVEDYQASRAGFFEGMYHRASAGLHRGASRIHGFIADRNRPF